MEQKQFPCKYLISRHRERLAAMRPGIWRRWTSGSRKTVGVVLRIIMVVCALLLGGGVWGGDQTVVLRKHNTMFLLPTQSPLTVTVTSSRLNHRADPYSGGSELSVFTPDGQHIGDFDVSNGESRRLGLALPTDVPAVCSVLSNDNITSLHARTVPQIYRATLEDPLITVGGYKLYFSVPKGTARFKVVIHASSTIEGAKITVRDGNGRSVFSESGAYNVRTELPIQVSDPGVWSLEISAPEISGLCLEDVSLAFSSEVPPYLATTPEGLMAFLEKCARYAVAAPDAASSLKGCDRNVFLPQGGTFAPDCSIDYFAPNRSGAPAEWRTRLPFPNLIDYGRYHVKNRRYLQTIRNAPPVLLQVGKDLAYSQCWGPILTMGGENQAGGKPDEIRRLTPEELKRRIAELQHINAELHQRGARYILPYLCAMTICGDPMKRSGFWEFYDHASEYAEFGLKMDRSDPSEWLQRNEDGTAMLYYKYGYPTRFYPRYEINHRLAADWHSPGWRSWTEEVTRMSARCGYDGVFLDNGTSQRSRAPHVLEKFRSYLRKKITLEQLSAWFGVQDYEQVVFPKSVTRGAAALQLMHFQASVLDEMIAAVRQAGATERADGHFLVSINGGAFKYDWVQAGLTKC